VAKQREIFANFSELIEHCSVESRQNKVTEERSREKQLNPEELFRPIDEICRSAPPLEPLWGFMLFKKAITSIVGAPGVCKTTFGYGLGFDLTSSKPFLDIMPEEPVKVLYMDFESADSLIKSRKSLISESPMPHFIVYNLVDYYIPQVASEVVQFCKAAKINLVFIDNQSVAFNTRDENDNAEAIKQMVILRKIANASGASLVIFHHTSKGNLPGTRKGTGAYARARLADICINLEVPDEGSPDVVRLEVVKNRLIDEKVLWYFKKKGGKFIFCDPPLGVFGKQTNTQIYKVQTAVLDALNGKGEIKFGELTSVMESKGFSANWTDHAVRRLLQQSRVSRPRYGYIAKTQFAGFGKAPANFKEGRRAKIG
jgi:hypothetical protein